MLVGAHNLLKLGSDAVLLKGGRIRISEDYICNVQVGPEGTTLDVRPAFLQGENTEILYKSLKTERATEIVADVLCQRSVSTITLCPRPRLQSKSTHGTGWVYKVRVCTQKSPHGRSTLRSRRYDQTLDGPRSVPPRVRRSRSLAQKGDCKAEFVGQVAR